MPNNSTKKNLNSSRFFDRLTDRALISIIVSLLLLLAGINFFVAYDKRSQEPSEPQFQTPSVAEQ